MKLYLVTWNLSKERMDGFGYPRILHTYDYNSQFGLQNDAAVGYIGCGNNSSHVINESWIFTDLEQAKKKANELSNVQHKVYSVAELTLVGHYCPSVARWEDV